MCVCVCMCVCVWLIQCVYGFDKTPILQNGIFDSLTVDHIIIMQSE